MIGHNYYTPFEPPERDISKQVIIKPWRKMLDCLNEIPAKYLWAIIGNPKNCECCRDPENLSLEIRKTLDLPEINEPDLYVARCGCGREHIRLLAAPGHIGNPANQPKFVLNPLFKGNDDDKTNTEEL
jgi:hypothetical protein